MPSFLGPSGLNAGIEEGIIEAVTKIYKIHLLNLVIQVPVIPPFQETLKGERVTNRFLTNNLKKLHIPLWEAKGSPLAAKNCVGILCSTLKSFFRFQIYTFRLQVFIRIKQNLFRTFRRRSNV